MIELVAAYGLAWIIKESELLARPRNWLMQRSVWLAKLLYCWYCVGFWTGAFIYLLQRPDEIAQTLDIFETGHGISVGEMLIYGFAGSGASGLLNLVANKLELTFVAE
jgi:hypothetical protein